MVQVRRPEGSWPGIYAEGWSSEKIIGDISNAVLNDQIVALRIADQPPYGFLFRVDKVSLIEKVWLAKGRVNEKGEPDLSRKPVTSLSSAQLDKFVDWEKLEIFGYSEKVTRKILDTSVHVVLPIRDGVVPDHLVTFASYEPTMSIMKFSAGSPLMILVEEVCLSDPNALVGGTSLNKTGEDVYLSSDSLLAEMAGQKSVIDYYVLSEVCEPAGAELSHAMIALENDRKIGIIREGIGMDRLKEVLKLLNMS